MSRHRKTRLDEPTGADLYDDAEKAGNIVTMMFGPVAATTLLPDVEGFPNRDWIPWDRTRYEAAKAEGVKVTVNVQINRQRSVP